MWSALLPGPRLGWGCSASPVLREPPWRQGRWVSGRPGLEAELEGGARARVEGPAALGCCPPRLLF